MKCEGLRILGLSKTFKGRKRDCFKDQSGARGDVEALKNVYLEVSEGELLGVMGHNGAGKTTLINTLCGYVQMNKGGARLFEMELERDMERIRRRMGVVSQFDVLWDELTAVDHMRLFSEIKRVKYPNPQKFFN